MAISSVHSSRGHIGFDATSTHGQASAPKHVALPKLPHENELLFEFQTMLLFITSMSTQYLNLYRTVWWLTQSHVNTAMVRGLDCLILT